MIMVMVNWKKNWLMNDIYESILNKQTEKKKFIDDKWWETSKVDSVLYWSFDDFDPNFRLLQAHNDSGDEDEKKCPNGIRIFGQKKNRLNRWWW